MSVDFDPSGDYAYFDGLQAVTYRSRGATTVDVSAGTVADAHSDTTSVMVLKRLVDNDEMPVLATGVQLKVGDAIWEVPYITGVSPRVGDKVIEADGTVWEVLGYDDKPLLSMWRLLTRK